MTPPDDHAASENTSDTIAAVREGVAAAMGDGACEGVEVVEVERG